MAMAQHLNPDTATEMKMLLAYFPSRCFKELLNGMISWALLGVMMMDEHERTRQSCVTKDRNVDWKKIRKASEITWFGFYLKRG